MFPVDAGSRHIILVDVRFLSFSRCHDVIVIVTSRRMSISLFPLDIDVVITTL